MRLYTSNRLEQLATQLTGVLDAPLDSPLVPEVIVVHGRGMARWLSLQIAKISKICMNYEFPFPRAFIGRTLRAFFPEMAPEEEYTVEALTWKINRILPALALEKEFASVRIYLDQEDGLKAFQLSEKIARLFDQYIVYRPEMLVAWERGRVENDWQAILWRKLVGGGEPFHLARMHQHLSTRMIAKPRESSLPDRVSVFGLSSFPPFYLRVFMELSRHCEVNLFLLDPSREYHGEDLPPKRKAKLVHQLAFWGATVSGSEFPAGNPLLTSLGKLNRDFTEVRLELDERAGFVIREQPAQFVEPAAKGMLSIVQRDIFQALNRGDQENPKEKVNASDGSIQIHACHSPMREVEVLYDHLLERFEHDPTLRPRDILVMSPNIEKYGPFIHTVFDYPELDRPAIPISVADRRPSNTSLTIETFLSLLALPGTRCTASEIFSLLERVSIRRRFAFSDEEMTLIRQWITESGIRWGIDAAHRATFQLPELAANTWRAGLQRCLLGFAMAGHNQTMFQGIMPYDDVEGGGAEVLGRLTSALEALFTLVTDLSSVRTLSEWPGVLGAVIDQFFLADTDEEIADLQLIRMALDQLRRSAEVEGGDQMVEFRVARYHLQQMLDQGEQRGGFLTGRVTFCALQPMRSIPARLICLIGMGDQDFPRPTQAPGFDLMGHDRKCGDRSTRDDDRYTFLEALTSARERLYLSYVGRSAIDNAEIPPSVLVSELLDYLDQAFVFPDQKTARQWMVIEHRLHAFSPRYFDGRSKGMFSYSEANAAASRNLRANANRPKPDFFADLLSEPGPEARRVELKSLIEFFGNPAKFLIERRLRLRFGRRHDALEDSEPFALSALDCYSLKQELVTQALEQKNIAVGAFAARGLLPLGEMGTAHFQTLLATADKFAERVQEELRGQEPGEPLPVDLTIGPFSLYGQIESIYGDRVVRFRCATLKVKDRLRAWISHLVHCAARVGEVCETILIGTEAIVRFSPVAEAHGELAKLLEIYWRGQNRVLPFFPESAHKFADAVVYPSKNAQSAPPLTKAGYVWNGAKWEDALAEKKDTYFDFCFADRDPLDEEFMQLALEVYEPMFRNSTVQS
jgi:exodeoxyribonuclease V gamma subunit